MVQKIKILEAVNAGYIIKNLHTNANQVIPSGILIKRVKWGIYVLTNPEMIRESLQ